MRAIILAGGEGRKLRPYTDLLPKPLMPLGGKPVSEILVYRLKSYGFKHITFCVRYLAPLIKLHFKDGKDFGVKIDYSFETKKLGTIGPLTLIKNLPRTFLVVDGDILTTTDFRKLLKIHQEKKATLTIGFNKKSVKFNQGLLITKNGEVIKYEEKPTYLYFAAIGVFIFERRVLGFLKIDSPLDLPQLINLLIKKKELVVPFNTNSLSIDIGTPDDLQRANQEYLKNPNLFLRRRQ